MIGRRRRAAPRAPRLRAIFEHHHHHRRNRMPSTTVVIALPTKRTDGSPLALSDIASVVLSKAVGTGAPTVLQAFTSPTSETLSFTDLAPDFGETDNYSAIVTDVEGNVSAAGIASVTVPPSQLAPPQAPGVTATYSAT
jgi:hypothetical protein